MYLIQVEVSILVLHKSAQITKRLHNSVADRQSAVMPPPSRRSLGCSRPPLCLAPPRTYSTDTGVSDDTLSTPSAAPVPLLSRLEAVDRDVTNLYGRQQAHVDHLSGAERDSRIVLQIPMLLQEDGSLAARLDDVSYLVDGLLEPVPTQRGRSAQTRSVLELVQLLQDREIHQAIELSSQRRSIQSKVKEMLLQRLRDQETQETHRLALAVLIYFLSQRSETRAWLDGQVLDAVVYALKQEQEKKREVAEVRTQRVVPLKKTCLRRKQLDVEVDGQSMATLAASTANVLDDFYRMQLDELLHDHDAFYVEDELQLSVVDVLCAALHNLLQVTESSSSSLLGLTQRRQQEQSTLDDAADDTFQLIQSRKRQLVRNGGIVVLTKYLAKTLNNLQILLPSTHAVELTVEFARSLHHVSLLLGVFDQVTFLTLDAQRYISKQRGFFGLLLKLIRLLGELTWGVHAPKRWDAESTRMTLAVEALLSALRVLINLTHHNIDAASHVHALGGMELFANMFSQLLTVVSGAVSTKRQVLAQSKWEFDSCLLLLSVMVNSIEFSEKNRDALAASVVQTTYDEATEPTQVQIRACDLFIRFFMAKLQSYKHLIDLTEAHSASAATLNGEENDNWNPEDVILGGCTSLLLGYLMKGSSANSAAILKSLPDRSPRLLLRVLGVFTAFHSQIGALTPEIAKSVLHVEKVFKSHQGYTSGTDESTLVRDIPVEAVCSERHASQIDTIPTVTSENDIDLNSTVSTESSVESRSSNVSPPSLRPRHQLKNMCSNLDDSDEDEESHVERQDNGICLKEKSRVGSHDSQTLAMRTPTRSLPRSPGKKRPRAASPMKTPLQTSGRSPLRTNRNSPVAVLPDGSLSSPVIARLLKRTRQLVEEFDADLIKMSTSAPAKKNGDDSERGSTASDNSSSPCMVFTMDVTCCNNVNDVDQLQNTAEDNCTTSTANGVVTDQEVEATLTPKRRKKYACDLGASMTSSILYQGTVFDFVPTNSPPLTPLCKETSNVLLRTPTRTGPSPGVYRQSSSLNLTPTKSSPSTPLRMKKSSGLLRRPTKKNGSPTVMQSPISGSPHRRKTKAARIPASTGASSIFDFTD